jgi:hypothetical protein
MPGGFDEVDHAQEDRRHLVDTQFPFREADMMRTAEG